MAEILYIRLGSEKQDHIHWLITSPLDDEIIASGELDNAQQLIELSEKSKNRQVIVFVPACDVALKSLYVPSKSSRAMKLAAPYMLEDEFAQDVEKMFFAYHSVSHLKNHVEDDTGDTKDSNNSETSPANCFIAAVDKTLMQQWLAWLHDAGIFCKVMIPDVLAMPLGDKNHFSAIMLGSQVIVRQDVWQGFTLDQALWAVISQRWSVAESNNDEQEAIIFDAYSPLSQSEQLNINAMPEELPLALLAQQSNKQHFNLLQGEFLVKDSRSPVFTHWLWAAGIALFALLFNFGIKTTHLYQLTSQQDVVNQQIISLYKKTFPQSKKVRVSTIKSQLKRKLNQVGGSDNQGGFLAMLTKVRPAFANVPELKPESLKFDGKRQEMRINAVASDYQYFEKFKTEVEKTQLFVTQGSQSNQEDQVSGSFSISAKGSKKSAKTRGNRS
jgi:general secretion pathway protein L